MDRVIGVLGGGQLGRMLTEAANRLNISVVTLDAEGSPAKQINANSNHVNGSFKDPTAIRRLARDCDVLTVEIEHVDTEVLEELARGTGIRNDRNLVKGTKVKIQPSWRTIRIIQDKYRQKEYLLGLEIATAQSLPLEDGSTGELEQIAGRLGYPLMLKSRTEAYDGRGNHPVRSASEIRTALDTLRDRPLYAEQWADFQAELAVMVVKTEDDATGDWKKATLAYPVVETVHEDSICKLVYAPARGVSSTVMQEAQNLARRAVAGFWGKGVFGVEMFLLRDGKLLVNEIAPRPHNSGHYTIEACPISQYDAHVRAILGLPIPEGGTRLTIPDTHAIMLNILGGTRPDTHLIAAQEALSVPGARIHLYGKGDARPGRKMGHITIVASSMKAGESQIKPLVELIDQIRAERKHPSAGRSTSASASGSKLTPSERRPLVAVTMGSDSDRSVLKAGVDFLKELDIPHSVTITSAHRTPSRMFQFAQDAAGMGVKVIIAAAGGAAHLPGMIASSTPLPVIGVPVKGSTLDGMDSLLSIVQMPRGVPVATVGINNSINAAQLAVRILGVTDDGIRNRLETYLADQGRTVVVKAERMESVGFDGYDSKE
ncbi:MAG: phosphoribosylaminoimidazole carboxylase [Lasallia pustulata]|uniref:Phosphoribosylaminoimidazole carboxylase n=1 Tax=Lasallia pustulata TaxID=136370 RepID=A0A5M8PD46_9LECA|nr:MAG: phosphoribosylaminoimidazole carboxylase [Lasallia pustulata]